MIYKITYTYEGKKASTVVQPTEGWEHMFHENCIHRIDSLTRAGAKIIDTQMYNTK